MFSLRYFLCMIGVLSLIGHEAVAKPDFGVAEIDADRELTLLQLPPDVEVPSTLAILEIASQTGALKDRSSYLPIIVRAAEASGVPPAVADAVVRIESRYQREAVGRAGEIGLMQVRPTTAASLGFSGSSSELADPEINIRLGVSYLARAWRLSGGDLCRALMKYRSGHRSVGMTALSMEYCRRVRLHLAATGTGPRLEAGHESPTSHVRHVRARAVGAKHVITASANRSKLQRKLQRFLDGRVEPRLEIVLFEDDWHRLGVDRPHDVIRFGRQE
jgi:hypothetical protein